MNAVNRKRLAVLAAYGGAGLLLAQPTRAGDATMALKFISTAFTEGGQIPAPYTCDGKDMSPPLAWSSAPPATRTWAIIADDPDAPGGAWVHWVVYNLPASVTSLAAAIPPRADMAGGGQQGRNDFRRTGYSGPCPPAGTHRYVFTLYSLDSALTLGPGATKDALEQAMKGHILDQASLMARYSRTAS